MCSPSPILMLIASQIQRVLDSEERQCIQCLSPQGVAKFNRDQSAGIPLESTIHEPVTAFRHLKTRCDSFAQAIELGTVDSSLLPRWAEHPLSPTDVANLVTSLSSDRLKTFTEKRADRLADLALSLRDHAMMNCARRVSASSGMRVSTSCLAPTSLISQTPKSKDSLHHKESDEEPPSSDNFKESVDSSILKTNSHGSDMPPLQGPIRRRLSLRPSLVSSYSAPDLTIHGRENGGNVLPPLLPRPRYQVTQTGQNRQRVSLDPSEAWFDLTPERSSQLLRPLSPKQYPRRSFSTTALHTMLSRSPSKSILKERLEGAVAQSRSPSSKANSPWFGSVEVHLVPALEMPPQFNLDEGNEDDKMPKQGQAEPNAEQKEEVPKSPFFALPFWRNRNKMRA